MKKFTLFVFSCLLSLSVQAQFIGLKAGYNLSSGVYKVADQDIAGSISGYQLGAVADIPMGGMLSLSPGVLLSKKGIKLDVNGIDVQIPVTYLDFPLNVVLRPHLKNAPRNHTPGKSSGIAWFVEAGPFVGIALSAKSKANNVITEIPLGPNQGELNRIDVGLNYGAGIEHGAFRLGINSSHGFVNLENVDEVQFRNNVYSISAVYFVAL